MGKGGKGSKAKAAEVVEDDDALLDAAIADNEAAKLERLKLEEAEAKAKANAPPPQPLTKQEIVAKMNELPTFTIVDAQKQFVALALQDEGGQLSESCVFWTEPNDAKSALAQARKQRSDTQLDIAAFPLGNAYALTEGWAEAKASHPFRLRA